MIKKIAMITAVMIVGIGCMATTAFAEKNTPASTTIPVTYQVTDGFEVHSVFTLEAKNDAPMPQGSSNGKKEVVMTGSGKVEFGELNYTRPDIYEYTLSKKTDHIDGMTADDTTYTIFVMVTYDGQANIIIRNEKNGEKPEEICYVDTIIGGSTDDPPVLKKVEGKAPKAEAFEFKLKSVSENAPMPEGAENGEIIISTLPGKENEIGIINFTKPGEYDYEITEVNNGLKNYKYDETVFSLHYVVEIKDGKWVTTRTVKKDGKEVFAAAFEFTNTYIPPEEPTATTPTNGSSKDTATHSKLYNKTIGKVTKTGDTFNLLKMAATMLIAMMGIIVFLVMRLREKKDANKG